MGKKFGLLGEKLSHSFSPKIHSYIFEKIEIDGEYDLFEREKENIKELINEIKEEKIEGINVTIPYKEEVIKYLDEISQEAKEIGAVNTVVKENGILKGYNSDYYGFKMTIEKLSCSIEEKKAVVLGAGGSARAIIKALLDKKALVYLVSRNSSKAKEKFSNFKDINIIDYEDLSNFQEGELIVNTTPCGMYPNIDSSAVTEEIIKRFKYAVDLIYNPEKTLFLKRAEKLGLKYENGLYMLVGQAIKAEEIWNKLDIKEWEEIYLKTRKIVYKGE